MRHAIVIALAVLAVAPTVAQAQTVTDVVVMRRSLAPPKPRMTPTPTPTPAASLYSTCTDITVNQGPTDTAPNPIVVSQAATSPSAAQDSCTAYLTANKVTASGVCYYVKAGTSGNSYAGKAVWFSSAKLRSPYGDTVNFYGALCSKK